MGKLLLLIQIFLIFLRESWVFGYIAVFVGIILTIISLILFLIRVSRKIAVTLVVVAFLPLLIGFVGTVYGIRNVRKVVSLKREIGYESKTSGYNETESKYRQVWFPTYVGGISSITPLLLALLVVKSKKN